MKHLAASLLSAVALFAQNSVPIENDKVKVVKVTQTPHVKTRPHKHDMNRVMIYVQPGKQTFDYQGAKPNTAITWKAGEALWSPAAGMHVAEIVSDGPVTIFELEL